MVKKVTTNNDYSVLTQVKQSASNTAHETLTRMSIEMLLKNKVITKNFKSGLMYRDHYSTKMSNNKLMSILVNAIVKKISFMDLVDAAHPFLAHNSANVWVTLNVIRDPSIIKYVDRMNTYLRRLAIPFQVRRHDPGAHERHLTLYFQGEPGLKHAEYYRILFFIPQLIQAAVTLSRKAVFANQEMMDANRSSRCIKQNSARAASAGRGEENSQVSEEDSILS